VRGPWRDREGRYRMLSVGIDIALVSIGHGRVDNHGTGLLNNDDIHWKRGQVLEYVSSLVRPLESSGYKLGDPTAGQTRR
jgi:hypothetical protein